MALIAYLIGAVIEGTSAASALAQSFSDVDENLDKTKSRSTQPLAIKWQTLTAIATVSICGAVSWPCRLIHRSLKDYKTPSE